MTFEQLLIIVLVSLSVIREAVYQYSVQRLVNKLMSRNFYDFKVSEDVGKISKKVSQKEVTAFDGVIDPLLQDQFVP